MVPVKWCSKDWSLSVCVFGEGERGKGGRSHAGLLSALHPFAIFGANKSKHFRGSINNNSR